MLGYKIYLIEPVKVPRIANNYKKTDKEDWSQPADIFRNGGMREIYISSEYGEYYILGKAHELLTSKNKPKLPLYTELIHFEHSSGERTVKGYLSKQCPFMLRFFLVETTHSLIGYAKKFKSK